MVTTKRRPIEHYIKKIEAHLLRRYPQLEFRTEAESEREVTIYYRPYSEENDYDIIHRSSGIATDALVDDDYRIWVMPD